MTCQKWLFKIPSNFFFVTENIPLYISLFTYTRPQWWSLTIQPTITLESQKTHLKKFLEKGGATFYNFASSDLETFRRKQKLYHELKHHRQGQEVQSVHLEVPVVLKREIPQHHPFNKFGIIFYFQAQV